MENTKDKCSGEMDECQVLLDEYIHSRRCFITGEYCSKQTNVLNERKKQYREDTITAFVIMNFSDMSDIVYKWHLKPLIESIKKYLYINNNDKILCCSGSEKKSVPEGFRKIQNVRVVRSDSDPVSNYVVCSRICQQMQIADIIIVDVSSQNANVFYEFGMAVALGKLILPICYSESFYKRDVPWINGKIKIDLKNEKEVDLYKKAEHHLGCYPWRKKLFEYYGIWYKGKNGVKTKYEEYDLIKQEKYGFDDIKYNLFPYDEKFGENETSEKNKKKIGKLIYEKLKSQYNEAIPSDNTLIVYTLEGFLNEEQVGICIVNFYNNVTLQMKRKNCFGGERVGVLVQENVIPEEEKDSDTDIDLNYNVGEIIHIGVNQATYLAAEEKIKPEDGLNENWFLSTDNQNAVLRDEQNEEIKRFVKSYIRNRGILIYPNNPVYVSRIKNQIQSNILDNLQKTGNNKKEGLFCLYHVMLENLCYTNEIVVDITDNCPQCLFWLGAAHGADVHAITVQHEKTDIKEEHHKKARNIFDISGLWTAVFEKRDTDGFYQQLALAQLGIERHSKLMTIKNEYYEKSLREYLYAFNIESEEKSFENVLKKKKNEEYLALESYYRKSFWNHLLRYNRLRIYLLEKNNVEMKDNEPRIRTAKWDFSVISALSHYLSKRTVIGEYCIRSLLEKQDDKEAIGTNFICIGSEVNPLEKNLTEYISEKISKQKFENDLTNKEHINIIHQRTCREDLGGCQTKDTKNKVFKGFERIGNKEHIIYTQHSHSECAGCKKICGTDNQDKSIKEFYSMKELEEYRKCSLVNKDIHYEIAQLILYREVASDIQGKNYFRVGMCGSSGPATYGLSALFVDEEQKKEYFGEKENIYLLNELQTDVRKDFVVIFRDELKKRLNKIQLMGKESKNIIEGDQRKRYFSLVEHAVCYYISTVLYRYFLPFLSEMDIIRIYNGMKMYIFSMKAAKVSPFALDYPPNGDPDYKDSISDMNVNEIIEAILSVLLKVLRGVKGLEAFYRVTVGQSSEKDSDSKQDTRIVHKIERMKNEKCGINYFLIFDEDEKTNERHN